MPETTYKETDMMRGYDTWKTTDPRDRPFPRGVEDMLGTRFWWPEWDAFAVVESYESSVSGDEDGLHTDIAYEVRIEGQTRKSPHSGKELPWYEWLDEVQLLDMLEHPSGK